MYKELIEHMKKFITISTHNEITYGDLKNTNDKFIEVLFSLCLKAILKYAYSYEYESFINNYSKSVLYKDKIKHIENLINIISK